MTSEPAPPLPLRVIVAGAGLGGLCLAQGLRRAGVGVDVLERDPPGGARPQGYRLHLDARGLGGLEACLPRELLERVRATAGRPSRRLTILDRRLRERRRIELDAGAAGVPVDRGTLGAVLLTGLEGAVRFGAEVAGVEQGGAGVRAHLAGGGTVAGDVLVGADGSGSAVRRAVLPGSEPADAGWCVFGRTPLRAATEALLPAAAEEGFCAIFSRRSRLGLALGVMRFASRPPDDPGDYAMWALSGRRLDAGPPEPDALRRLVLRRIRRWDRHLHALVEHADPGATARVRIRSASSVAAWPAARIALLGDARRTSSPAGGSGANLALQDAAGLCEELVARARAAG